MKFNKKGISQGYGPNKTVELSGDRIGLLLTQGKMAIIDRASYPLVSECRWNLFIGGSGIGYAVRNTVDANGTRSGIRLHRLLTNAVEGQLVDHRDGDGLNNCLSNLRIASYSQNNWHRRKSIGKSIYKGVDFNKQAGMWRARIAANKVTTYLGYFDSELDAALAYDAAAVRIHGDFCRLNFA